jgi:hypothetical protein
MTYRITKDSIEAVMRDLRYYTGLNLDYTHSREYGYQLVVMRDNKGGIERTLGRAIFGTGNFYDVIKTASDVASMTFKETVRATGYNQDVMI